MAQYILRRLLFLIPTILLVTLIVFTVMRLVPGDPVALLMRDVQNPELAERLREEMGLNKPIVFQYLDWLGRVLTLDLGTSTYNGQAVATTMVSHFLVSLQVVTISVVIASILAIVGGTLAAWRQNRSPDVIIVLFSIMCMSVPSFWLGIAFILLFGVGLQWLPTIGYVSPTEDFFQSVKFLILPVTALAITEIGGILRMVRSTTIDVLRQEYITHARAKGLSEMTVLFRHALKNTAAPVLTLIGFAFGTLLGGAAAIETVFTLPGIGRLLVTSIYNRDYAMVQGIMLLISFTYILINLVVDLLYPVFDPRVKL